MEAFKEKEPRDSPHIYDGYQCEIWAFGYNTALEKTKALELINSLKQMYYLAEKMGIMLESTYWTEEFRSTFNPIMTKAENLIESSAENHK